MENENTKCVECGNIQDKKWDECEKCGYTYIDKDGLHSIERCNRRIKLLKAAETKLDCFSIVSDK